MKKSQETNPIRAWREMRNRLTRAVQATDQDFRASPEQAQAILLERARRLARVPPDVTAIGEIQTVLVFTLGENRLALETRQVREVLRAPTLTPVPGVEAPFRGLINLRGQLLPVFELGQVLGLPVPTQETRNWALIVGEGRPDFAILAQDVVEVVRVSAEKILPPQHWAGDLDPALLSGVTADALVMLKGTALLRDPRFFVDQGIDANPL